MTSDQCSNTTEAGTEDSGHEQPPGDSVLTLDDPALRKTSPADERCDAASAGRY